MRLEHNVRFPLFVSMAVMAIERTPWRSRFSYKAFLAQAADQPLFSDQVRAIKAESPFNQRRDWRGLNVPCDADPWN